MRTARTTSFIATQEHRRFSEFADGGIEEPLIDLLGG